MPTVGWVYEDAVERFWEGQPVRKPIDRPHPAFYCLLCRRKFSSPDELRRHYTLDHPLELPALYIQGQPLLRESVIRLPLQESDVVLDQCNWCIVQSDGGEWQRLSIPEFRKYFAKQVNSTCNVRLVRSRSLDQSRTEEEYQIRFRIPEIETLNMVDEHFLKTLVLDELRHSDLEKFENGLSVEAPAREYGSALGNYALGIILKEQRSPPRAPVGFEEFAFKMRSSLEVLCQFNRPVALAVSGSIRFNLNDFNDHGNMTAPEIENGLRFFCSIIGKDAQCDPRIPNVPKTPKSSKGEICPVDRISHRLLNNCEDLLYGDNLPLSELEALRQLTRGTDPVSEQDLAKIHVICAEGYFRLGRSADAIPHLRAVQFNPLLKEWAQRLLEDISKHEN